MIIDLNDPASIAAFIVAVIMAIFGWWNARQSKAQVQALVAGTPEAENPVIVASLPMRSWKMNDATKSFLVCDATPENRALILQQVYAAEEQKLTHYFIHFNGGYQEIEYGLIKGGAGNPSGKQADNYVPPPVVQVTDKPVSTCPTGNCPQVK